MAIILVPQPGSTPTSLTDWTNSVESLKQYNLSVNQPLDYDFSGNTIKKGTQIIIGGANYYANADTAITGTASNYVKITSAGVASYVASLSGVTWNNTYNFYADGTGNAYIFNEGLAVFLGTVTTPKTKWGKNALDYYGKNMNLSGLLTVSASGITSSSASVDILKPVNINDSLAGSNARLDFTRGSKTYGGDVTTDFRLLNDGGRFKIRSNNTTEGETELMVVENAEISLLKPTTVSGALTTTGVASINDIVLPISDVLGSRKIGFTVAGIERALIRMERHEATGQQSRIVFNTMGVDRTTIDQVGNLIHTGVASINDIVLPISDVLGSRKIGFTVAGIERAYIRMERYVSGGQISRIVLNTMGVDRTTIDGYGGLTHTGLLTVSASGITSSATSIAIVKPAVIGGGAWNTVNTLQVNGSASIDGDLIAYGDGNPDTNSRVYITHSTGNGSYLVGNDSVGDIAFLLRTYVGGGYQMELREGGLLVNGGVNTDNVTVKNRLYTGVTDASGNAIVTVTGITSTKILSIRCYYFTGTGWSILTTGDVNEVNSIRSDGLIDCRGRTLSIEKPYRMYVTYEA